MPIGHESDSQLQVLDEVWREMHYPPETTSINLICKILAMVKQVRLRSLSLHASEGGGG